MKTEDISQKTIRGFLLGELDQETIDTLDERSIADQEFADRVSAEQYEIIDEWVAGRLERSERAAFSLVLARSPALVDKVKIAEMMAAAPRVAVVERDNAPGFFVAFFGGFPRPAYVLGGLALLIGIAVTALLLVREDRLIEIAEVSPTASQSPPPVASVDPQQTVEPTPNPTSGQDLPPQNSYREDRTKPSPEPTRRSSPLFATLVLTPPTRGGGGVRSVALPPGTEFLQLTIQTEAESSGRYVVEVGDPAGKTDWKSPAVRGSSVNGRANLTVRIPAASLRNGIRAVRLRDAAAGSEILDEHIVKIDR